MVRESIPSTTYLSDVRQIFVVQSSITRQRRKLLYQWYVTYILYYIVYVTKYSLRRAVLSLHSFHICSLVLMYVFCEQKTLHSLLVLK